MTTRDHARRVLYRTRIDALVLEYQAARTPEERFRVLRKLERMRDLRARFEARHRDHDPGETLEKAIVPCI